MIQLILVIISEAISILQQYASGAVQKDANVAASLLKIVQAANNAYQQHTGQPIDPAAIKPE